MQEHELLQEAETGRQPPPVRRLCIIVEGPEGSGKSTLASILSDGLGLERVHTGGPPASLEDLRGKLNMVTTLMRRHFGRGVVFDRVPYISDPIYREVRNGTHLVDPGKLRDELVELQAELSFMVIMCKTDMSRMIEGADKTPRPYASEQHKKEVWDNYTRVVGLYEEVSDQLRGRIIHFVDYDFSSTSRGVEHVLREIWKFQSGGC